VRNGQRQGAEGVSVKHWLADAPVCAERTAENRQRTLGLGQLRAMPLTSLPSFSIARSVVVVQGKPQLMRM
jgi:hypothetical protein